MKYDSYNVELTLDDMTQCTQTFIKSWVDENMVKILMNIFGKDDYFIVVVCHGYLVGLYYLADDRLYIQSLGYEKAIEAEQEEAQQQEQEENREEETPEEPEQEEAPEQDSEEAPEHDPREKEETPIKMNLSNIIDYNVFVRNSLEPFDMYGDESELPF